MDLARMRTDYGTDGLDAADLPPDPLEALRQWIAAASAAELVEPNAFVLATMDPEGQPWTRHLLAKEVDDRGVAFYTSETSAKGRQLAVSPRAAATFAQLELERQVNLAGTVERLSSDEADAYFALRPRSAQLGAWASQQSQPLATRAELDARLADLEARWPPGTTVGRPPHWGGYRLVPHTVEFWQGRASRLHDRLRFTATEQGWELSRLNP